MKSFEPFLQAVYAFNLEQHLLRRFIAYAGQSVSLLARFDQHLSSMLSLSAPLRDASGTTVFTGDAGARIAAYGNITDSAALAAADTGRVRFWYAMCDEYFHIEHLNLVEGLLQRRITDRLSDVENAVAAPGRMPDNAPDRRSGTTSHPPRR